MFAALGLAAAVAIIASAVRLRQSHDVCRPLRTVDQSPVPPGAAEEVRRDDVDALQARLRERTVAPDGTYDGMTLLALAARSGSVRCIRALAQAGCVIDVPIAADIPTSQTPLGHACEARQTNAVIALLECGANIDEGRMAARPVVASLGDPAILGAVIAHKPSRRSAAVAARIALAKEDWVSYEALVLYLNRGRKPKPLAREDWLEDAIDCDCPCGFESLWEDVSPRKEGAGPELGR